MDKSPHVSVRTTSHFFLEGMNDIGVDYMFCNLGTDHAPLIEEMARWGREGRKFPKTILCPHENTAIHMAAGVTHVTGRAQAVMVHVDAGTGNIAMGAHNLRRGRVPVLLIAGKAPHSVHGERVGSRDNYVHFIQEPRDQGGILRNYVKWEWTLPSGVITKEVLRRAHSVACSDPCGPVYLMLPRETLAEEWDEQAVRSFPAARFGAVRAGMADPTLVDQLVDRLLRADFPVMVASYAGRNAKTPALMEELAQLAGVRVYEGHPTHMNIPRDSACFGGYAVGDTFDRADLGLLVDVDVPWIPKMVRENAATYWAHIDVDVIKEDFPMWGFASNLRMQGDSALILRQVIDALRARADDAFRKKVAARLQAMAQEAATRKADIAKAAAAKGTNGAVAVNYVCAEIAKLLGPDDIVVNEAVRNVGVVLNQIPRTRPGTYLGFAGGGLGCSGGMALGAKLGRPGSTVMQITGDGGFYFNNPQSTLAVARQYNLPYLWVVLDNSGWSAVKEATLRMYSDGDAKATKEFQAMLSPDVDFAKAAESVGGHGERVSDPEALPQALQRAIGAVKAGRPALVHVKIPQL